MIPLAVSIEKAVVVRFEYFGRNFEILVDPEKALEFKRGKNVKIEEILATYDIFRNVRSVERVSSEELQKTFGTTDVFKVAEKILKDGELRLTTEQRRRMVEERKMQIANLISKKGVDPRTNTPHPPQRILKAMEDVGINVNPFLDAESQVDGVLKEIKKILPISTEEVVIQLKIPAEYAGKSYSILKRMGSFLSEKWLDDGSLVVDIRLLAGMQPELFQKVSTLTHGNFESKILRREI